MAGRNIQLNVVTRLENSFISQGDYQDIFWNIFYVSPTAMAFTNREGQMLFCNDAFNVQVLSKYGFTELTAFSGEDVPRRQLNSDVVEITIDAASDFQLCRMTLHSRPGGAAYLWFGEAERKAPLQKPEPMPESTFELIFRTGESHSLLFFNQLFLHAFEFTAAGDAMNFSVTDLFHDNQQAHQFIKRVMMEKHVMGEQVKFKTRTGKTLTALVNCHMHYNEQGRVLNWTVLDISERVRYEESLEQKNMQLAKLNAQMEKFLYSTSHDLRSPLTSILGLVNLLRLEMNDKPELEYVSRIESSALRLDKIIRDIMSYSKTTYQHIDSESIAFEPLLRKVINLYSDDANFKRIQFEIGVQGPSTFYSDAERIEIILDCLVRNAIHFVDTHKVRSFVNIQVALHEEKAVIEIMDNGIGIGRQHLDQVFNMFYKASLQSRGAGLGLYIVKEGVAQLNGTVKVESEIGFGTIFRLELPNNLSR